MDVGGQRDTPAALPPGKIRYPVNGRLDGHQDWTGLGRKFSHLPGYDRRTAQHVASHIHRLSHPGQQSLNVICGYFSACDIFYYAASFGELFHGVSSLYV